MIVWDDIQNNLDMTVHDCTPVCSGCIINTLDTSFHLSLAYDKREDNDIVHTPIARQRTSTILIVHVLSLKTTWGMISLSPPQSSNAYVDNILLLFSRLPKVVEIV